MTIMMMMAMMMMAMMMIITKIIEMHNRPGIGESASWDGRVCTRWFQGGIYIFESFCIDETNINDIMELQHICIIITTHPIPYLSGFGITVDIEDESSGTWMPIPPNRQSVPTQGGM